MEYAKLSNSISQDLTGFSPGVCGQTLAETANSRVRFPDPGDACGSHQIDGAIRGQPDGEPGCQPAAFFTSAPIRFSSAAVNSFSANAVGHMAPSSRSALSLNPNVAYLVLNLCALW